MRLHHDLHAQPIRHPLPKPHRAFPEGEKCAVYYMCERATPGPDSLDTILSSSVKTAYGTLENTCHQVTKD